MSRWKQGSLLDIFATAAPGLESIVRLELQQLGIAEAKIVEGGVSFMGDLAQLYKANLSLRVASRVIARIAHFHAESFHELERRANRIRWSDYLSPGSRVRFRVTCRKSRLYHSDAVAQRFVEAVAREVSDVGVAGEGTERKEEEEEEGDGDAGVRSQLFIVRLTHDDCVVSVDSSGALLHRRGYRLATGKAPLRETLAAAMVMSSGWDHRSPFIDPMCGSGTIAIEAALLARRIRPGVNRSFAFQRWPSYRSEIWMALRANAAEDVKSGSIGAILASDRDNGVVTSALENAVRASVNTDIDFQVRPISAIDPPPAPGYSVTNPPYGTRVGERNGLKNLYAQLGKVLKAKAQGYSFSLLSADRRLEGMLRIPLEEVFRTRNGGIPVRFMTGQIP